MYRCGFTLLEAAIVLVIIGLVAGGILLGRELIETAALRAQITQVEALDSAANTFRTKYNYIPGDLPAGQAAALGFVSRSGAYAQGDANGFVNGTMDQSYGWPTVGGETLFFWDDLSSAGLSGFDIVGLLPVLGGLTVSAAEVALFIPPARIGRGFVMVYGQGEKLDSNLASGLPENNYQLVEFLTPSSGIVDGMALLVGGPLTPIQALAIDQKLDDALPASGAISAMATGSTAPVTGLNYSIRYLASLGPPLPSAGTDCVVDGVPIVYNTATPDQANRNTCSLRIRAGF